MVLWVSAARDRARTVHSEWDPPKDSHSSAPNLRHTALGCASSPQTPMAGWCLFSDPTGQGHVSPSDTSPAMGNSLPL